MAHHLAAATELLDSPVACPHHWVIQSARGPMSAGVCQICGAVKEFKNYVDASYWNDESAGPAAPLVASIRSQRLLDEEDEE